MYKKYYIIAKKIIPRIHGWFNTQKSLSVADHIKGITEKNIR